jgi:hypothetical protein
VNSTKTRACELEDGQKTSQRRAQLALSLPDSGLTSLNLSSTPHERGVVQRVEYTKRVSERKYTVT